MQTEVDAITQVRLPGGQILKRPEYPELPLQDEDQKLSPTGDRIHRSGLVIDGHRFRTLTVALSDGSLLQLAKDTQVVVEARTGMRRWFPLLAALQVVIAAFVGWLFARRITRPIENLASAAESIAMTQDLTHDIPAGGAGEVGTLVDSFNSMLTALRSSLSRQRQLVQDASHELRTPLNGVLGMAEIIGADLVTPQQRERLEILKASGRQQLRLVEELLDVVRLRDGAVALETRPFRPDNLLRRVANDFRGAAEALKDLSHVVVSLGERRIEL